MENAFVKIEDISHVDVKNIGDRSIFFSPLRDGDEWHVWAPVKDGEFIKIKAVDLMRSYYYSKSVVHTDDLYISFLEFMWQRMSWPQVSRCIKSITEDIHLISASAAKLEHFYIARDIIDKGLITSFVNSEIEHLLVISRSLFDLMQEALAYIWNHRVVLTDPNFERNRKQRNMPTSFRNVVLEGEALRTPEDITIKYSLPPEVAAAYAAHAPFFKSVRGARDQIVHAGKTPDSVYATERGFCVSPRAPYFSDFPWKNDHHYNENLVTLVPWLAWLIGGTLDACSNIVKSMSEVIAFPPPIVPDYSLYLRDPANPALMRILDARHNANLWWRVEEPTGPRNKND